VDIDFVFQIKLINEKVFIKNNLDGLIEFLGDLLGLIIVGSIIAMFFFFHNFYIGLVLFILSALGTIAFFYDFNNSTPGNKQSGVFLLAPFIFGIIGIIMMLFSDYSLGILC